MFKNISLMRKTIFMVVAALCASAALAAFAFVLAGENTAYNYQIEEAVEQMDSISVIFDKKESSIISSYSTIFTDINITGRYLFIVDNNGNTLSPIPDKLSVEIYDAFLQTASHLINDSSDEIYSFNEFINNDSETHKNVEVLVKQITVDNNDAYMISIFTYTPDSSITNQYLNILLLSTLAAALTMLIPVTIMVTHIIEPIQAVNDIAREYGKGNFSLRARETYSGEVGQLAHTFNSLADQLNKSFNDITNERNRFADIFSVISEGIAVFDETGTAVIVNDTLQHLFTGVSSKNLFTERLRIIPFEDVWNDVDEAIISGVKKERIIEGPDYAFMITIVPKFDIENPEKCVGATGFFRDIYEEQKLERTRRDYVANISHELRTPLQTLRGLIEPLADGIVKKEEDKIRYYNIILNETMRLSRLIDDMLELSKLQSRTLAFKTYPFDANSLLQDMEAKFMPVMREAGLNFRIMFNTGTLPTVMGNPDRVEQILVILLDNARKYTPEGGYITISTEYIENTGKVYFSVSDTGQGIHEYDINHIFDRFFKADRARGKKGTGLGLAIAKELLDYMGEDITVQSERGKGTTFTFTLKKAEAVNAWY